MKTFLSLKKDEYIEMAPKISKNANNLFDTAESAAKNSNYGVACSLTILGTEELIKSFVVYLRGYGARVFDFKDLSKVFTKHQTKHETILLLKGVNVIFEISKNLRTKPSSKIKSSSKKVQRIGNAIIKIMSFMQPIAHYIDDVEWWEKANDLKNNGLYVNYINHGLLPQNITEADYIECKLKAVKVKSKISHILSLLSEDNYRKEIIKLINDGIEVYNSSSNSHSKLALLKQNSKTPNTPKNNL